MSEHGKPPELSVVKGDREAIERELLWNVALGGDPVRREQLCRMLTPAANAELVVTLPALESTEGPLRD